MPMYLPGVSTFFRGGFIMKIVKIEEINKKIRRLTIDGDKIYLSDAGWIRKNYVTLDSEINEIMEKELKEFTTAYSIERALKYIEFKRRTKKEVENHLIKISLPEDIIKLTLSKMINFKIIDDKMYARDYIEELIGKRQSTYVIKMKLIKKGLDSAMIEALMDDLCVMETEADRALKLLEKKYGRGIEKSEANKMRQYLYRKGFSSDAIRKSVECIFDSID